MFGYCKTKNCKKKATFGFVEKEEMACKYHKTTEMIHFNIQRKSRNKKEKTKHYDFQKKSGCKCFQCQPDLERNRGSSLSNVIFFLKEKGLNFNLEEFCDVLFVKKSHFIIVEIDEEQHKHYRQECEITRMYQIQQSLPLPIIFIRYNPHSYKIDGKTKRTSKEQRLKILLTTIQEEEIISEDKGMKVVYLFYDQISHNHKRVQFLKA